MNWLLTIWIFINDVVRILTNNILGNKNKLLVIYLRIRLNKLIYKHKQTNNFHENLFGFDIHFFNYDFFLICFREVFINNDYYFFTEKPEPAIIDCGANIGIPIIYFKMLYPNAKIFAFEPDEKTFKILSRNIKINNYKNIKLFNNAIYNIEGKVSFYYDPLNHGALIMSILRERIKRGVQEVNAVLLSNYINGYVDFLKMDIEGSEDVVMKEIAEKGKLKLINEIVLEYHHHIVPHEDKLSKILKILEDNGFGYQITTISKRVFVPQKCQDILIYAYHK